MSRDHEGDIRQFIQYSRAWYSKIIPQKEDWVDEVTFGLYSLNGGTSGEMSLRWYKLGKDKKNYARLEVFEDAFSALSQLKDVIDALREFDGQYIQPEKFCELLISCGFVDNTKEEQ